MITALTSGPWLGPAAAIVASGVSPFLNWLDIQCRTGRAGSEPGDRSGERLRNGVRGQRSAAFDRGQPCAVAGVGCEQPSRAEHPGDLHPEAHYAEFWAQDSGAMYSYAGSAAAATKLAELPAPAEVVNPSGMADQAIAVFKAQYNIGYNNVRQHGVAGKPQGFRGAEDDVFADQRHGDRQIAD